MTLDEIADKYHLPIDTRLPDSPNVYPPGDNGDSYSNGYPSRDNGRSHIIPYGSDDGMIADVSDGLFKKEHLILDDIVNDIVSDPSIGPNRALVEFAQPCIRDKDGVDFSLFVKPGQKLNEDTVIGTATIDGKKQYVKSIFASGTILANENGRDFYRLFRKAGTNRHFVVDNYVLDGQATDLNPEALE